MIDFGSLPSFTNADVWTFVNHTKRGSSSTIGPFQSWQRPRGKSMVFILAIGGGAGGGNGFTAAAGNARGGGGGGGPAHSLKILIPAMLLPDTLYISPGAGGLGGGNGGVGSQGDPTVISYAPFYSAGPANAHIFCSVAAGTGGGAGSGTTAGTAGAAGSVSTMGQAGVASLNTTAGTQAAAAAGAIAGAAGVSVSWGNTANSLTCGGAGGGSTPAANTNFAGGNITGPASPALYPATISGGAAGGGAGGDGICYPQSQHEFNRQFFYLTGGAGGGTNGAAGTGGKGGNGAYGCGGGGGGGGVTGGTGGDGGGGLVLIAAF